MSLMLCARRVAAEAEPLIAAAAAPQPVRVPRGQRPGPWSQPGLGVRWVEPAADDEPGLIVVPPTPGPRPARVVVCVHGYTRQPLDQLQAFAPLAAARGDALVLPLFDERHHRRYQQLLHPRRGTRSDLGLLRALGRVATAGGFDDRRLCLFGYSGGAQFVHRFALRHPERTAALAIGAAGWYAWPDVAAAWPSGLGDAARHLGGPLDLDAFVRLPIALWVGERDNVADALLRNEPGLAQQQGHHRLERAQRWAEAVRAAARARGVAQPAPVHVLPKAGHDFAACHRRGNLAGQVMDFFDRHHRHDHGSMSPATTPPTTTTPRPAATP
jgi:poly(3-hydroxybutyrate) depolymerase